jgi:hypothetical protein
MAPVWLERQCATSSKSKWRERHDVCDTAKALRFERGMDSKISKCDLHERAFV